ncbi:MAG: nucleoid-associated protein [Verrucomicrobiota bacterium]
MGLAIDFKDASLGAMMLAKVGNPSREEKLLTSKTLCRFADEEAELLTHCFLKSFRALEVHQLHHHADLSENELFGYAAAIFDDNEGLLREGAQIARHLHATSSHPNIKAGDLCVALIDDVVVEGQAVQALSIIKSENKVPFLQVSEQDGDLRLTTQQGIYPDKIDKGCLIVNHDREEGFTVYLFDKSGNTQFWNRDFVGAIPVRDEDYLTRRYSELCVSFAEQGLPEETVQEERMQVANRAISCLEDSEAFDLDDFRKVAFEEPGLADRFSEYKADYEAETGLELEDRFRVSPAVAKRARNRLKSRMRLDTGVELRFSSGFIRAADGFLERGYDADKQMKFVKVYYHNEV